MDWVTPAIFLKHKNTGTFGVLGIILNQDCLGNTNHYDNLPLANEFKNLPESFTHQVFLPLSIGNNQFYVGL